MHMPAQKQIEHDHNKPNGRCYLHLHTNRKQQPGKETAPSLWSGGKFVA